MPQGNKKKNKKDQPKKESFKSVGRALSISEVRSLAKAKKTDPLTIMSKALEKGIGLGSKVVDAYNTPGGLGNYRYQGTPSNITPLKGLSIGKGNLYYGSAESTTTSRTGRETTTYNPIVAPRSLGRGAAPAVGDTAADTAAAAGDGTTAAAGDGTMDGDQYDFQSMLDALTAMQQPQFDMGALTDMFNTQFEQLSSQFDTMNPLQLAQLGKAYGSDAIRARQRMRKTRQDYRRGLPAMALGQSLANLASMGIGGGVTL